MTIVIAGEEQVPDGHIFDLVGGEEAPRVRRSCYIGDPCAFALVNGVRDFTFGGQGFNCAGQAALGSQPVVTCRNPYLVGHCRYESIVVGEGIDDVVGSHLPANSYLSDLADEPIWHGDVAQLVASPERVTAQLGDAVGDSDIG